MGSILRRHQNTLLVRCVRKCLHKIYCQTHDDNGGQHASTYNATGEPTHGTRTMLVERVQFVMSTMSSVRWFRCRCRRCRRGQRCRCSVRCFRRRFIVFRLLRHGIGIFIRFSRMCLFRAGYSHANVSRTLDADLIVCAKICCPDTNYAICNMRRKRHARKQKNTHGQHEGSG